MLLDEVAVKFTENPVWLLPTCEKLPTSFCIPHPDVVGRHSYVGWNLYQAGAPGNAERRRGKNVSLTNRSSDPVNLDIIVVIDGHLNGGYIRREQEINMADHGSKAFPVHPKTHVEEANRTGGEGYNQPGFP